jgi:hypothetical protein
MSKRKVFVVESSMFSGLCHSERWDVIAVCATLEGADEIAEQWRSEGYDMRVVEEWDESSVTTTALRQDDVDWVTAA